MSLINDFNAKSSQITSTKNMLEKVRPKLPEVKVENIEIKTSIDTDGKIDWIHIYWNGSKRTSFHIDSLLNLYKAIGQLIE